MEAIEIIPLTPDRVVSFRSCLDRVAREGGELRMDAAPLEESILNWLKGSEDRSVSAFVALSGEKVIGWADIVYPAQPKLQSRGKLGMGVLSEYRGQGIGRRLLGLIIESACELNLHKIVLEVYASNKVAICLYDSSGFKEVKRDDDLLHMARPVR